MDMNYGARFFPAYLNLSPAAFARSRMMKPKLPADLPPKNWSA